MYPRKIEDKLLAALKDTPVVMVNGARQCGKSTLVQALPEKKYHAEYITLDDSNYLTAVIRDPQSFITNLTSTTIIDEIQRAPELFLAIKHKVDRQRKAGEFLLTGSANVLLLPQVADSLAGRMEVLNLWPLAMQEISGKKENFIDLVFSNKPKWLKPNALPKNKLLDLICQGGYPEAIMRSPERRQAWFDSYLLTILQRDIKDLANIEGLYELPHLLKILAARNASLLNFAELSRTSGIPQTTLKRYMILMEALFLISYLPPWYNNHNKRLVKSPKILLNDTGIAAHLLGINSERLILDQHLVGRLLEAFVINEMRKQSTWCKTAINLYHFRTQTGQEVDLVLEARDGSLIGIEIKSSKTLSANDFQGLDVLANLMPKHFMKGILFYTGNEIIPFGKNCWALPINCLWD